MLIVSISGSLEGRLSDPGVLNRFLESRSAAGQRLGVQQVYGVPVYPQIGTHPVFKNLARLAGGQRGLHGF